MRPKTLSELIGHEDLVGPQGVLRELILTDRVPSMILWAGPGVRTSKYDAEVGWQNDVSPNSSEYY